MSLTLSTIKELRHAVVNALVSANIDGIGENVYEARRENLWPEEGLVAVVYTDGIRFEDKRTSPKEYVVTVNVVVDVICQSEGDNVNDTLDDATVAVITALQPPMPAGGFFGGLTKRFVVTNVENNLSEAGEMSRGLQRITFETMFGVPLPVGGPVNDFLRAKTTIRAGDSEDLKQEFVTNVRSSNA